MTSEQQQVKEMMQAFNQECPETPTIPDLETRKLRAKLILEEALETIKGLGIEIDFEGNHFHLSTLKYFLSTGRAFFIESEADEPILKDILDGCEDLKVVTEGTLLACGLCPPTPKQIAVGLITPGLPATISYEIERKEDPHFNEVMCSNMSKMWTREEFEHDWPEGKSLEDIEGTWINPGVETRFVSKVNTKSPRCYIVKDKDGKFIKSPSYSPPNFNI